jgi:hypothetical protein
MEFPIAVAAAMVCGFQFNLGPSNGGCNARRSLQYLPKSQVPVRQTRAGICTLIDFPQSLNGAGLLVSWLVMPPSVSLQGCTYHTGRCTLPGIFSLTGVLIGEKGQRSETKSSARNLIALEGLQLVVDGGSRMATREVLG